jgi:hypothetical protein
MQRGGVAKNAGSRGRNDWVSMMSYNRLRGWRSVPPYRISELEPSDEQTVQNIVLVPHECTPAHNDTCCIYKQGYRVTL